MMEEEDEQAVAAVRIRSLARSYRRTAKRLDAITEKPEDGNEFRALADLFEELAQSVDGNWPTRTRLLELAVTVAEAAGIEEGRSHE
jgi:hypothetical protein